MPRIEQFPNDPAAKVGTGAQEQPQMPLGGKLSDEEIAVLKAWIDTTAAHAPLFHNSATRSWSLRTGSSGHVWPQLGETGVLLWSSFKPER